MGEASTMIVRTHGLDVVLGGRLILAGIDLTVRTGEVVALLGANGSGKSTLVRAVLGIVPVAAGTVRLFGTPLGPGAPWHRIGYVPQRVPATTGVPTTPLEVVMAGLLSGRRLRPPHGARRRAAEALDGVGLSDRLHRPVQELSGGQQQRVLIARALVREPDLLVLDEPTTGIDLTTQETFVQTVDLMRRSGTAVVVVLHETEPFAALLDRAVVLRHGRVVHDGPPPPARAEHAGPTHEHAHPHPEPPHPDDTVLGMEILSQEATP